MNDTTTSSSSSLPSAPGAERPLITLLDRSGPTPEIGFALALADWAVSAVDGDVAVGPVFGEVASDSYLTDATNALYIKRGKVIVCEGLISTNLLFLLRGGFSA